MRPHLTGKVLFSLFLTLSLLALPARAEPVCTAETLADAVDAAGADLRAFSSSAQPQLRQQLAKLRDKKKWPEEGYEEKGLELVRDARIAAFDEKADELLTKIDTLGRTTPDNGQIPCSKQDEVRASASELLALMRTKAAYLNEKLNRELGQVPATSAAAPQPPDARPTDVIAKAQLPPATKASPQPPPKPASKPAEAELPTATTEAPAPPLPWNTTTAEAPPPEPYPLEAFPNALAPEPSPGFVPSEQGYTIDEIKEVTRGFFGTISTSLASVIEHAFKKSGRPAAYVLGTEGGAAFLAGLRYGEGMMYLRSGGTQKVYWHGPSIGSDFGAAGSRTLFLIYNLTEPELLFRRFTGVDGSAYLVGGVGVTFLKGGDVVMAPIRSGLGLRLGANIGYVRFTPSPTWNPF